MAQRVALTRWRSLVIPFWLFASAAAGAQVVDQPRLHVRTFVMSASSPTVVAGNTVHLVVEAHVDEQMDKLGQVTLPDLSGFDTLADERRVSHDAAGTRYVETLTLRAVEPGTVRLAGASLVAVDAATGRLSRFTTNAVTIAVLPAAGAQQAASPSPLARAPHASPAQSFDKRWWLVVAALAIAGIEIVLLVRRRRKRAIGTVTRMNEPEEEEATFSFVAPLAPRVSEAERFRMIIANITLRPTRQRIVLLRDYLRERAGARDDETFGDLLARLAQSDRGPLVNALRLVERAAFIGDEHLVVAINECVPALRTYADWLDETRT